MLQIIVNSAEGVSASEALDAHVRESFEKVEKRFGDWLTRVEVFLSDVNSSKGGADKHCRIEARPRGIDPVVVDHSDVDLYVCVNRAVGKLENALDRKKGQRETR